MSIIVSFYLFILGAIFGSFILVVVDRTKSGRSWTRGRSKCDSCKKTLQVLDLVPVISWLKSGGKCRYCHDKLSISYPLTELVLGLAFAFSYVFWPYDLNSTLEMARLVLWLASLVLMMGMVLYDLRWYLLPNFLVFPLIAASIAWAFLTILIDTSAVLSSLLLNYFLAILVSSGVFFALFAFSKGKWIGDGDIRLGVAIAFFVGSWQLAWFTILIASIFGLIFALPTLLKTKKKKAHLLVPFGPMLILALYITVLFGQQAITWYEKQFLLL